MADFRISCLQLLAQRIIFLLRCAQAFIQRLLDLLALHTALLKGSLELHSLTSKTFTFLLSHYEISFSLLDLQQALRQLLVELCQLAALLR